MGSHGSFTVAIVGMGNVGATTAYALTLTGGVDHMLLYNRTVEKAHGELCDLDDALAFLPHMKFTATDVIADLAAADVIIVTAGKAQQPGQTRLDLAKENSEILTPLFEKMMRQRPDAIYVIASNPVDVITQIAVRTHARITGTPWSGNVFGTGTLLDTARLRVFLSEMVGVYPKAIHAYVLGEHGDSSFPALSAAVVGGEPLERLLDEVGKNDEASRTELTARVRGDAGKIIQCKGATSYGIATALTEILRAVRTDSGAVYPLSVPLTGEYGIEHVCLSLPCLVGGRGVRRLMQLPLSSTEQALLHASARAVSAAME